MDRFNEPNPRDDVWVEETVDNEASSKRAELHLHTRSSAFGGLSEVIDYFRAATERDINAIAITDLGSVQAYPLAEYAAWKYGIKPIYGVEFYIEAEGGAHRVTILAKNKEGIQRIYDLVTISRTKYTKEHIPFIPLEALLEDRQNILIGLAACDCGIISMLNNKERLLIRDFFSFFDFIEVAPYEVCSSLLGKVFSFDYQGFIKEICENCREFEISILASSDACYVESEDAFNAGAVDYSRLLDPIRQKSIKESEIKGRHFRSTAEMLEDFDFLGEKTSRQLVIDSPNKIAEQIEWVEPFQERHQLLPLFQDADQTIADICFKRLKKMFFGEYPTILKRRLEKELKAIRRSGGASIFFTCHLLAEKAKKGGHLVSCRGLAGNSFVAYLLGITEVNPLVPYYYCPNCHKWSGWLWEYRDDISSIDAPERDCLDCTGKLIAAGEDLPLEMFYGLEGEKMPDIDLVFSTDYLPSVLEDLRELFGNDRIVRVGTIETLPKRSASLRVKKYCEITNTEIDEALLEKAVQACMSSTRSIGQHTSAYCVLPLGHPWNEFTPLQYPNDFNEAPYKVTHYPQHDLSRMGLYKFDLFGNPSLTILERLSKETGVDLGSIRLNDPALTEVLCGNGKTTFEHIPGYQSDILGEIRFCTSPKTFSDLVKVKGILHGTGVWDYYKNGFASGELSLSDEIITNRDDLFHMLLSYKIERRLAYAIVESIRKGRGITPEMKKRMEEAGVPCKLIGACESIKYLFPKDHILEFLYQELRLAYFKLHYSECYERIYDGFHR